MKRNAPISDFSFERKFKKPIPVCLLSNRNRLSQPSLQVPNNSQYLIENKPNEIPVQQPQRNTLPQPDLRFSTSEIILNNSQYLIEDKPNEFPAQQPQRSTFPQPSPRVPSEEIISNYSKNPSPHKVNEIPAQQPQRSTFPQPSPRVPSEEIISNNLLIQSFQRISVQQLENNCSINRTAEQNSFFDFEDLSLMKDKILQHFAADAINLSSMLTEIIDAVPKGILNPLQVKILFSKLLGATIRSICSTFGISSIGQIETILKRTACGRKWDQDNRGGGTTILSKLDEELFIKNIIDRAEDINCISTHAARILAHQLQKARIKKAKTILMLCRCPQLADQLKVIVPDRSWLKKAAERMGILVVPKKTLEEMRRAGCDKRIINLFFDNHGKLMDRSPLLIFNMDETMISSNKKFKVLCPKKYKGLSVSEPNYPHITACVTIGASGVLMKPMIILPNKKTIRGIEEFIHDFHIASSSSGWMNKKLFTFWALCFVSETLVYRLNLPEHLREQRILLIMDGHKSRANFFAVKLFDAFGIDLLILPGHTTHLLQPFDICVASSLKTEYKKNLLAYVISLDEDGLLKKNGKLNMKEVRKMMLICFLDALHSSAKPSNIKSGFLNAGIYPLNRDVPLQSEYAMNGSQNIYNIDARETINNMCLNSSREMLAHVYKMDHHSDPSEDDFTFDINDIFKEVNNLHDQNSDGWALSKLPDLLLKKDGNYERLSIDK